MGKYKTVEFDHADRSIVARVYLGTTLGRGDDPDEVISLNVAGQVYLTRGEELVYGEIALEKAREL